MKRPFFDLYSTCIFEKIDGLYFKWFLVGTIEMKQDVILF